MTPGLIACPSCAAMLRVPDNAAVVRCPRCKTEIPVGPPPAAALPPPAPPKKAIPLPFGRSTTPEDPAEPEVEIVESVDLVPDDARRKAKLVADEDAVDVAHREERERTRRRLEEEKARDERKMARMEVECKPARQGMQALALGAAFYGAALILCFLYATAYVIGFTALLSPLLYLAATLGGINWLLSVVGLGLCLGGPRPVRPMAASALIFAAAHVVLFAVQLARSLAQFGGIGQDASLDILQTLLSFNVLGSVSNLNVLSDLPGNLAAAHEVAWLGTAGGVLELTRLIMIGMLAQHYAGEGKEPELGHQSMAFVARVFLIVLGTTALKLIVKVIIFNSTPDVGWAKFAAAAVSMLSAGLFMFLAVVVLAQARTMADTAEVVTPLRFGSKKWVANRE